MHRSRGLHGEHRRPGAPLLIAVPDVVVGLAALLIGVAWVLAEGTGLGLSISYGIVRDHEGTVDVETGEERGTRFVLTFPAAPEGRQA